MSITNTSKPTTTLTNATKASSGETWASILTTWANEIRTWQGVSQLVTNTTKNGNFSTIDSNDRNGNTSLSQYTGNQIGVSQSFKVTIATVLDSCTFRLSSTGSPTGNVSVTIYAHSGTYGTSSIPTGAILATSNLVDVASLAATPSGGVLPYINFNFSTANRITLVANTNYVAVVNYAGGDVSNKVNIAVQTTGLGSTHAGNAATSNDLSSWVANANWDIPFLIYGYQILMTNIARAQ